MVDAVRANIGAPHGGEPLSETQEEAGRGVPPLELCTPVKRSLGWKAIFEPRISQPVVGEYEFLEPCAWSCP
jgi:hypothetical protein